MTFFYLVAAKTKKTLRNILNINYRIINNYSSIYRINNDDNLYLGIEIVSIPEIVKDDMLWIKCQKVSEPRSAIELLNNWVLGELTQDISFISYETNANNQQSGCSITFNNYEVTRLYQPLTELMLIINNTPDSFSEHGALFNNSDLILETIEKALQGGINLIDIGAESTRPGASVVSEEEEIKRLHPLLQEINRFKTKYNFKISLDSYKPIAINKLIDQVDIINDVSGNLDKNSLVRLANEGKIYLPMHSLTIPADKNINISLDKDPISELLDWGFKKIDFLYTCGFHPTQIILDPGIGFNKNQAQSWYIIKNIDRLKQLGLEILIGHSRKSFLNKVCDSDFSLRDFETAMIGNYLCHHGIDYLRIHNYSFLEHINRINNQLYPNKL